MFKLVSLERWDNWYVKLDGQEIGNVYKCCGSYQCFVCTPDDANAIVPGTFETPEAAARAVAEAWLAQQDPDVDDKIVFRSPRVQVLRTAGEEGTRRGRGISSHCKIAKRVGARLYGIFPTGTGLATLQYALRGGKAEK